MKQIHELNERVTALGLGDVLAVDNGNDTEKIDYTKLAKAIIEQYNLSSLGGSNRTLKATLDALQDSVDDDLVPKSDIINNVTTSAAGKVLDASQGKVLQDQVTALNSSLSLFSKGTNATDSSYNLNDIKTPGAYYVSSGVQNYPTEADNVGYLLVYGMSASAIRVCQILVDSQRTIFTRAWTGSWSSWVKQPTRSEIDALNSNITTVTTHTINWGGKTWSFYKIGRIVWFSAPFDANDVPSGSNNIGTLPEAFRPIQRALFRCQNSNYNINSWVTITIEGAVSVYRDSAITTATNFSFGGCYITA